LVFALVPTLGPASDTPATKTATPANLVKSLDFEEETMKRMIARRMKEAERE